MEFGNIDLEMYCEPEVLEELTVFMSQAQTGQEVILVYFPRKSKLKSNKHEMKQALKTWPWPATFSYHETHKMPT